MLQFDFLQGIIVFITILFFLLFYFKTSRSVKKTFYPIMFFKNISYKSKRKFFLQYFFRNKYFWIQFLILLLLLTLFLKPYFLIKNTAILNNNIIIVDTSASTSIIFDKIVSKVKENLGKENTIILSGKPSNFFLEDQNYQNSLIKLPFLKSEIKSSDLDSAFILAYDKIKNNPEKNYNVILITDLKSKLPSSYFFLKSKNVSIKIIPVLYNNTNNIGIVNYDFKNNNVFLKIKNFNNKTVSFNIKNNLKEENVVLNPNSFKTVVFPLNEGENIIKLYYDDIYNFDNQVYFYNPSKKNINVLLITTKEDNSFEKALKSINYLNVNLDVNKLGVINKDYDLIILYEYNTKLLLPSFYNDVKEQLKKGALLVIGKNDNINDLNSLLPYKFFSKKNGVFNVYSNNSFFLNNNVIFSSVKNPYNTFLDNNNTIILSSTNDDDIIVSFTKNSYGKILYFGYDDNDVFKNTPYFPIFVSNIIDFVSGINNFYDYNIDTNRILEFKTLKKVEYNNKIFYTKSLNLKNTGFYKIDNNIIAVNLFDEEESNPNIKVDFKNNVLEYNNYSEYKKFYLNNIIIFLIILLILLELYFMKKDLLL